MDTRRKKVQGCTDCGDDCCSILQTLGIDCNALEKDVLYALSFSGKDCIVSPNKVPQPMNMAAFTLKITPQRDGTKPSWFYNSTQFGAIPGNITGFTFEVQNFHTQGIDGFFKKPVGAALTATSGGSTYQYFSINDFLTAPSANFQIQITATNSPRLFTGSNVTAQSGAETYVSFPLWVGGVRKGLIDTVSKFQFGLFYDSFAVNGALDVQTAATMLTEWRNPTAKNFYYGIVGGDIFTALVVGVDEGNLANIKEIDDLYFDVIITA